jgi:hypothetical protein
MAPRRGAGSLRRRPRARPVTEGAMAGDSDAAPTQDWSDRCHLDPILPADLAGGVRTGRWRRGHEG